MTAPDLAVRGLSVHDDRGRTLVNAVDLALPASGALTVIGETGSGKSLVAQAMFGLLPRHFTTQGWLRPNGRDAVSFADRAGLQALWRRWSLLLPQEPNAALDPTMRLGRQLAEIVVGNMNAVASALADVDLPPDSARRYPFELSGGMSQRALVAAALLADAPVLVADEPTKGLDPARIDQTLALFRQLRARGTAILAITHDLNVARGIAGHIAVMKDGRIVEQGPSDIVLTQPRESYTRAWLAADPRHWPRRPQAQPIGTPALTARGLTFGWPGQAPLFRGLDIDVARGMTTAIVGPSGCGKTTLGNILLGLRRPDAGRVSWAGDDPYTDWRAARGKRRRYQKLHQDPATAFIPHRSIGAQLNDLAELGADLDIAARLPPLLDRLRLPPTLLARYPAEISGGEAQRMALLRLLLLKPDAIVADEPTSRLDPIVQREVIDVLRDCVARDDLALVLISHDASLVAAVADKTVALGGD